MVDRYVEGHKDGYEDGKQNGYDKWLKIIKLLRDKIDKSNNSILCSPAMQAYYDGYKEASKEAITEIDNIFEED